MFDSILSVLYLNTDIKKKNRVKINKSKKNRVYRIVYTLLITPDLLKMLMEKERVRKTLYFEAVARGKHDNYQKIL